MSLTIAFVSSGGLALLRRTVGLSKAHVRLSKHSRVMRMSDSNYSSYSSPPTTAKSTSPPEGSQTSESVPGELDTEALKSRVLTALNDVSVRPGYYAKIGGYLVGGLVALTVLRAIVSAVDSIPVLPSALELIGLGYTTWFVWRYVLFKESRKELLDEVEDLIGRARPGSPDE